MPPRKKVPVTKEVMDVDEVAEYLGLSSSTIYKKVQTRDMPFTKIGTLLRFTKRSIDQWLARNTTFPDDQLYDEFARLQNRYHFKKWLDGRGVDWRRLTEEQLAELVAQAITDLQENPE